MKISELTQTFSVDGSEVLPIVQSATTKKVTINDVLDLVGGGGTLDGLSDVTITAPSNNQVLSYDSGTSQWINATPSGGGSVNPTSTYIPVNDSGAFIDSFLKNDITNNILYSYYNSDYKGFYFDFANQQYIFGNFNSYNLLINVDDGNIKTTGNNLEGLQIDFVSKTLNLGDYQNSNTGLIFNVDWNNQIIKTLYGNAASGLYLDFANGNFGLINNSGSVEGLWIADLFGANKSIYLGFGDSSKAFLSIEQNLIRTNHNGFDLGLKLDFANNKYLIGSDYARIGGYSGGGNQYISAILESNGEPRGLHFQMNSGMYYFGESYLGSGDGMVIDCQNGYMNMYASALCQFVSGNTGLQCQSSTGKSEIGDTDVAVNGTKFGVEDNSETLIATSNLLVGTSGSSSGQHLKINVGGTDYVIELKNP